MLQLEGKASSMVKNLHMKSDTNGVVGWCKLMYECSSMTAQRMQGLASTVYSPQKVEYYNDVMSNVEKRESNATMFKKLEIHEMMIYKDLWSKIDRS